MKRHRLMPVAFIGAALLVVGFAWQGYSDPSMLLMLSLMHCF